MVVLSGTTIFRYYMSFKLQILLATFLFFLKTYSQSLDIETLYNFNNKISQTKFYLAKAKYNCALHLLKQLESSKKVTSNSLLNTKLSYHFADLYLNIGDSMLSEKYYLEYLKSDYNKLVLEIANKESKFYFIYKKYKKILDTAIIEYATNFELQKKNQSYNETLTQMITTDQFVRTTINDIVNSNFLNKDSISQVIWKKVDSINSAKLVLLIKNDKSCDIMRYNFKNYYILALHLTRYDTSTFTQIISYNEQCLGKFNLLNTMITDNRSQVLYENQKFYTYLLPTYYRNDLDFKRIDSERKQLGLPSLFYEVILYSINLPEYYKDFELNHLYCNE
jgi:hypothetical protein